MIEGDVAVAKVASESQGVLTRAAALRGLSAGQLRSRLRTGAVVHVVGEVYRVAGAPETWKQKLEALATWARKRFAFSHETAASLHQLGAFKEGPLVLTSTRRMRAPEWARVYQVGTLAHSDVTEVDGYTVTNVTRTLFDLADRTDRYTLRTCVDQALREKKTTLEDLATEVSRSKNRPGVRDMRALLADLAGDDGPAESELEQHSLDLIHAAGLPRPKVQWSLVAGRKRRRLDLFYKNHGVVIEADGFASHAGVDAFEDDRQRNNSLIVSGYRVLHWTWTALHERPDELIAELYVALNLRS